MIVIIGLISLFIVIIIILYIIYTYNYNFYLYKYIFIFISLSFFIFIYISINSNIIIYSIYEKSHSLLPFFYKIAGIWTSVNGSIFLWVWLIFLSNFSFLFLVRKKKIDKILFFSLWFQLIFIFIFITYLYLTSNPYLLIETIPINGKQFSAILLDPVLIIHPPLTYVGYIISIVPASLIFASFITKKPLTTYYILINNFYCNLVWVFLTVGIILGSWWAYYTLGWSWWYFDPVENIALSIWIVSTGAIHFNYQIKDKLLKNNYNIVKKQIHFFFVIITFFLSLLGTFFVRSGFLVSVHNFIEASNRTFLLLIIASIFYIYYYYLQKKTGILFNINYYYYLEKKVNSIKKIDIIISISFFLVLVLLTGILYIEEVITILKLFFIKSDISLGIDYYYNIWLPCTFSIILLLGISYLRKIGKELNLFKYLIFLNLSYFFIISIIIYFFKDLPFSFFIEIYKKYILIFESLGFKSEIYFLWFLKPFLTSYVFNIYLILVCMILILFSIHLLFNSKSKYILAIFFGHTGLIMILIGIIFSSYGQNELIIKLFPGEQIILFDKYIYIFRNFVDIKLEFFSGLIGNFIIFEKDTYQPITFLFPIKEFYIDQNIYRISASIISSLIGDLYALLIEGNIKIGLFFRIYISPLFNFLWLSLIFFCLSIFFNLLHLYQKIQKN